MQKEFVTIIGRIERGSVTPLAIEWKDGRTFRIDKILSVRYVRNRDEELEGFLYSIRIRKAGLPVRAG